MRWTSEPLGSDARQLAFVKISTESKLDAEFCSFQIVGSDDSVIREEDALAHATNGWRVSCVGLEFCATARIGHRIRIIVNLKIRARFVVTFGFTEAIKYDDVEPAAHPETVPEVLVMEGPNFMRTARNGYDPPTLYFNGGVTSKRVLGIVARVVWADQGWGNRKGCIWMRIMRDGRMVHEESLFGIAPHQLELNIKVVSRDVTAMIRPGDGIEFWRLIGGGGGHALRINNFCCEFLLQPDLYERALRDMLSSNLFSDITLVSNDGEHIAAHRAVLAARSPVLRSLILEKCSAPGSELQLDLDRHTLADVLAFIYTGRCDPHHLRLNMENVVKAAHTFELEDLKVECEYC